jgi:hypothetical protein
MGFHWLLNLHEPDIFCPFLSNGMDKNVTPKMSEWMSGLGDLSPLVVYGLMYFVLRES